MFSRNFMRQFRIRKYGNPTSSGGSIRTDIFLLGKRDTIPARTSIFILTTWVVLLATQSFQIFYEIVKHTNPPYHHDSIDHDVSLSVSKPNEQVITKMKSLREIKTFMKSFQ